MNKGWLVISVTAVLLAACSTDPAGVGSYVASEQDGAMMVQITAIDDGRVTGTLSMVSANSQGKTSAVTRPLSGTLEGEALNLTIDNASGPSLITGTLDGDALRLTFFGRENSSEVVFTRSDAEKFNALVADTRQQAAATKLGLEADAAQQDRITRRAKTQAAIDRDADRLLAKAQELSEKLKRLDVITPSTAPCTIALRSSRRHSARLIMARAMGPTAPARSMMNSVGCGTIWKHPTGVWRPTVNRCAILPMTPHRSWESGWPNARRTNSSTVRV